MDEQDYEVETKPIVRDISVGEAATYSYRPSETRKPIVFDGGRILVPEDVHAGGFFDPTEPGKPPDLLLRRVLVTRTPKRSGGIVSRTLARVGDIMSDRERELFELLKPIAYHDKVRDQVIVVPADLQRFQTDLTSVPRLFTWLVPKTGVHLPAALLHDGLVHDPTEPRSYIADTVIPRDESDRIFRDGMRDLGASWLRRWLVWATVMLATLVSGTDKVRWRISAVATFAIILVGGTLSTIDLFDCGAPLPWMADRPWFTEVVTGGVAAVVITGGLSILWWPIAHARQVATYAALMAIGGLVAILADGNVRIGLLAALMTLIGLASLRDRTGRVALLVGLALSLLYHVTLAVTLVFGLFTVAESVIDRGWARASIAAGATTVLAGGLVALGVAVC